MKKFLLFLSLIAFVSCQYNNVTLPPPPSPPHYYQNVKTIIDSNCMHCHSESGPWYGHPVGFDTDSGIVANAVLIKFAVEYRIMPKGDTLSQSDINTIVAWANAGGTVNN